MKVYLLFFFTTTNVTSTSTNPQHTTQAVDSKQLSVKEDNLKQQKRASLAKKQREEEELERLRKFETSSSSANYDSIQEDLDAGGVKETGFRSAWSPESENRSKVVFDVGIKARLGRRVGRSPNPAPAAPVSDSAAGDDTSGDAAAVAKGPLSFVPDKFSFWRKGGRGAAAAAGEGGEKAAATSADEAVPPTSPAAAGSLETGCAGQTVERSPSYLSPRSVYQKSKEKGTGSRDNADAPPFPDLASAATAGEEEAPPSPPAMVEEAPPEEEATEVQNEVKEIDYEKEREAALRKQQVGGGVYPCCCCLVNVY
jgi:hypothetical protein